MSDLRIIDPCAPRCYDTKESLQGLGGTEATVIRIAESLTSDHSVTVEQAVRTDRCSHGNIRFAPIDLSKVRGDVILVINAWKVALKARRANPSSRILLWLHIHPGRHNRQMGQMLRDAEIDVICVSLSHAMSLAGFLPVAPRIGYIYNPIEDDLQPDQTMRDPDRLIFASSPHKGLEQVMGQFLSVRKAIPSLRLVIADPGYMSWPRQHVPEGIILSGALDHARTIKEFRRALCLFYPQTAFAETFGLVIAEANSVGCPALLHGPTGANREIASDESQCLDNVAPEFLIARISEWRSQPPEIRARPEFRLSAVAKVWRDLLTGLQGELPGQVAPF